MGAASPVTKAEEDEDEDEDEDEKEKDEEDEEDASCGTPEGSGGGAARSRVAITSNSRRTWRRLGALTGPPSIPAMRPSATAAQRSLQILSAVAPFPPALTLLASISAHRVGNRPESTLVAQ
jgi:hypothetical protein